MSGSAVNSSATAGTDARSIAFDALDAVDLRLAFVADSLDELFRSRSVPEQERALATELATGIVRRRLTLDTILAAHVQRPRENIEPGLWRLLQLGAYQLVLLSVAPHAAVHETVELSRRRQPRWSGFLNGVLRSVQRELADDWLSSPAADAVPVVRFAETADETQPRPLVTYRRLCRPYFDSPAEYPADYLSQAFSLPQWLVERWLSRMDFTQTLELASWFLTPGRMGIRVNRIKADRDGILSELADAGVTATPGGLAETIRLSRSLHAGRLPGLAAGSISIQDESAQYAAALLDPQPGQNVLDLCAAPGGKTTHLAERMQNQGRIIAVDVDAERLARVDQAARRLGLTIIETQLAAADASDVPPGPFDRILLDVPCSNTGVLGKRPEARWRISAAGIDELQAVQLALLQAAIERLAPGGRLVYSTCSIEPEENEDVVRRALAAHPRLKLLTETPHHPGHPADGGYLALLAWADEAT